LDGIMTSRCGRLAALVVALGVSLAGAGSAATSEAPAKHGADWIVSKQQANGAFVSAKQRASDTGETLAAVVAGGVSGAPVANALAYIKAHGKDAATQGAYTGRVIAGIVAGGHNPRAFGADYVAILHSQYNATTGAYDTSNFFADLIAANGANAAKDALPAAALAYIDSGQCTDGGFAFQDCSNGSDTDTTAWAINVLIGSGHKTDPAVGRARTYLTQVEKSDGGFGFSASENTTSSDSTGLAISAINALGEDATKAPWAKSGGDPVRALVALQLSTGAFRANAQATNGNLESTDNAIPGLAHKSYPIPPVPTTTSTSPSPHPTSTPYSAPDTDRSTPTHHASVSVDNGGSAPKKITSASGTNTNNATSTHTVAAATKAPSSTSTAKPSASVLGFGGISTKRGGLSIAAWGAIAAGCAGLGVGIWLLRARLR
jgi:hypothetical protein